MLPGRLSVWRHATKKKEKCQRGQGPKSLHGEPCTRLHLFKPLDSGRDTDLVKVERALLK